ncbi:hypothetical protein I4U23_024504 [Adineta vaga]|nr:hypothetical protein I4U23_024504 [Adineta vaga]
MHILSIVLIVYGTLDIISSSTIDYDLIEISNLKQDFIKYSPEIIRRVTQATCDMITQCCPKKQSKLVSMALAGNTNAFADECFDGQTTANVLANLISCSPFVQISTMVTDSDFLEYINFIRKNFVVDKEETQLILDLCTEQEMYSMICDLNQTNEQDTCQLKILKKWLENGEGIYAKKVQQTKDQYIKLIDALKKTFNH